MHPSSKDRLAKSTWDQTSNQEIEDTKVDVCLSYVYFNFVMLLMEISVQILVMHHPVQEVKGKVFAHHTEQQMQGDLNPSRVTLEVHSEWDIPIFIPYRNYIEPRYDEAIVD